MALGQTQTAPSGLDFTDNFEARRQQSILPLFDKNAKASRLMQQFSATGVNFEAFEQAFNAGNKQQFFNAFRAGVDQLFAAFEGIAEQDNSRAVDAALKFLDAVGEVSPTVQRELDAINAQKNVALQNAEINSLLYRLKNMQHGQAVYLDIEKCLMAALKQGTSLENSLAPQVQTAQRDLDKYTNDLVSGQPGNAIFDPMRRLGYMLYAMFELHTLAPYEAEMHPHAVFPTNESDGREALDKFNATRFNREGVDMPGSPAGAPAASTPPPSMMRPGGPGI